MLLKAVTTTDIHLTVHGECETRLQDSITHFHAVLSDKIFDAISVPTFKTLNERYKKIFTDRRVAE